MSAMPRQEILRAAAGLPATLVPQVERWLERMIAAGPCAAPDPAAIPTLVRAIACSDFAAATLLREWSWFIEAWPEFAEPASRAELAEFATRIGDSDEPAEAVKQAIRRYRHRSLLRVLWREIDGTAALDDTLGALSDLADELLRAASRFAARDLERRFGVVRDESGRPVTLVILGMGKLGGRELNFSSDIDLVFLYSEDGVSDGQRSLDAQQYFTRQSRQIIALLDEVTADGFAFRIDTRLRPFGESGPPVVGFAALETYLLQHGRGWERYAYVKARPVGPPLDEDVEHGLVADLITPFVYRRYLDYGVFESLREMRSLIAAEVRRRDMADNVKLGPGGIREIEFIVQSLQLVRGGSRPELQGRELLAMLPKLVGRHGLSADDARELDTAYCLLRRIENFIQAMRDQQTHDLPADEVDRQRLCVAMDRPDWEALAAELEVCRGNVTRQFDAIALRDEGDADEDRRLLSALWHASEDRDGWERYFEARFPEAAGELADVVHGFATLPATRQVDAVAQRRLREFMPRLLTLLRDEERPALALRRALAIVEQVLRRSAYLALLNENAPVLARLVSLCGQSGYIAQQVARYPVLLDELLDPRVYSVRISRYELEQEFRDRLASAQPRDSEERMTVLGQFQRASLFRVAIADFSGSLPIMRVSDALTDLAETVLGRALAVAWQDLTSQYGQPEYVLAGERRSAGFGIIAYGKLGGIELSYGSDLDLVFLHDSRGESQQTSGDRSLDNTMFFARLVRRLVHFLTTQTGSGALYEVDMRLRPDGRSGLLVTSTEAFERYQEENAWTWEHQALLRARPVAGSAAVAREFERIRADTLTRRVRADTLRDDVLSMRRRMRGELDRSNADRFDLKQGEGGIGDIEFIVQYLVLANAGRQRAVIHYPDNIRQLATLAAAGCMPVDDAARIQDIYRRYRLRLHHLTLDDLEPLVGAGDFLPERELVRQCWQRYLGSVAT